MKKITREFLQENKACQPGYDWFVANCLDMAFEDQIKETAKYRYDWANWLIVKLTKKPLQKLQYAIFAAEQALPFFENKYPKNKKAREAVEAAKKVLENNTEENRRAAADAASAAYGVYDAANAAYAAAAYAAANTAYAAAYAADADYDAAAPAYAAANAAYDAAIKATIINYGIKLITE